MFAIYKRELKAYFQTPIGYIFFSLRPKLTQDFMLSSVLVVRFFFSPRPLFHEGIYRGLSPFFSASLSPGCYFCVSLLHPLPRIGTLLFTQDCCSERSHDILWFQFAFHCWFLGISLTCFVGIVVHVERMLIIIFSIFLDVLQ